MANITVQIQSNPKVPQFIKGELLQLKPQLNREYDNPELIQVLRVMHNFAIDPPRTVLGTRLILELVSGGFLSPVPTTAVELGPYDSDWSDTIVIEELPNEAH